MLIQNNSVENEIVTLKLISGEEIIAKCVEAGAMHVTIMRPVVIQMHQVGPNQAGIAFAPFMVSTDEDAKITIPNSAISAKPTKTRKDIAANYIKMTTGLDVATGLVQTR